MKKWLFVYFLCLLVHRQSIYSEAKAIIGGCQESTQSQKLLLVVDPGVDDARAMAMAFAAHLDCRVRIIAIVVNLGNAVNIKAQTENVCILLSQAGISDIPVYVGPNKAYWKNGSTDEFFGVDGFNDFLNGRLRRQLQGQCVPKSDAGIVEMINIIKKYPNQVDVINLSPLTNLALALASEPALPIKRIFFLGGNKHPEQPAGNTNWPEFNARMDPEAAHVVFSRATCPVFIAPVELCEIQTFVPYQWRLDVLGRIHGPMANLLNQLEAHSNHSVVDKKGRWTVVYDEIALAAAIDPKAIKHTTQVCQLNVEVQPEKDRGLVKWKTKKPGKRNCTESNIVFIDEINVDILKEKLVEGFKIKPVVQPMWIWPGK